MNKTYSHTICRFNQATVEYNATNEEKVEVLRQRQDEVRERLREKAP